MSNHQHEDPSVAEDIPFLTMYKLKWFVILTLCVNGLGPVFNGLKEALLLVKAFIFG